MPKYRSQVDNLVTSTVKSADAWIATIDGWAVKVIMAAVALTALLSSAIIFVLGCCCIGSCCRRKTSRTFPHAPRTVHHPETAQICSMPSAKDPMSLQFGVVLRKSRFLALEPAFAFKGIIARSRIISLKPLSSIGSMHWSSDPWPQDFCLRRPPVISL